MDARRRLGGGEQVLDAAFGLALTALAVVSVLSHDPAVAYQFREPNAAAALLAFVAGVPLVVRRRWPLSVCLVTACAVVTLAALGFDTGQVAFCLMAAVYALAAHRGWRPAVAGLAGVYAGMGLLVVLRVPYFDHPLAVVDFVAMGAAWALGRATSRWRADRDMARERARAADRAATVAAERAVFADRLRIARELHDVVSHTLTVIAVQAGSARYRLGADHGPLAGIERASRGALDDLRRMLGLLRAETGVADPDPPPPPRMRAPVDERVVDGAIALALTVLGLVNVFVADPSSTHDYAAPSAGIVALVLAACVPLAVRRTAPVWVFAVAAGATLLLTLLDARTDVPGLAMFVALYTVAVWRRITTATVCLGIVLAGQVLTVFLADPGGGVGDLAGFGALVPWGLGVGVRRWRHARDAAASRVAEAHRRAAAEAQRAVFAERIRIAAEMEDVIAHTLSEIAVQSAVARHQADTDGPAAPTLAAIERAGRSALQDLRRMLDVLHADTPLTPNPTVDELALLASAHRVTHGPVSLSVDDAVRTTPASVQVTAYRLVQEALTNIRKHAPGATAQVTVCCVADQVVVLVDNDRPTSATADPDRPGGFGITGMRERVALFDGRLDAGPRLGGGFRVEAVLHLPAEHRVDT